MKSKDTYLLGVEITEELRQKLKKLAYEKDLSVSSVVRYILTTYFEKENNDNSGT